MSQKLMKSFSKRGYVLPTNRILLGPAPAPLAHTSDLLPIPSPYRSSSKDASRSEKLRQDIGFTEHTWPVEKLYEFYSASPTAGSLGLHGPWAAAGTRARARSARPESDGRATTRFPVLRCGFKKRS